MNKFTKNFPLCFLSFSNENGLNNLKTEESLNQTAEGLGQQTNIKKENDKKKTDSDTKSKEDSENKKGFSYSCEKKHGWSYFEITGVVEKDNENEIIEFVKKRKQKKIF